MNKINWKYYDRITQKNIEMLWDLNTQLKISDFITSNPGFNKFNHIGGIKINNNDSKYKVTIKDEHRNKHFWCYMITINDFIIKGGRSKGCLEGRRYEAGHHANWVNHGSSYQTMYVISQIFRECLKRQDLEVKFWGYQPPSVSKIVDLFGENTKLTFSAFDKYEKKLNEKLRNELGMTLIGADTGNNIMNYAI